MTSSKWSAWLRLFPGGLLLSLVACTSPHAEPLVSEDVVERVEQREATAPEDLRVALELMSLEPLGVRLATPEALTSGDAPPHAAWHALAVALAPEMRQARQRVLSRRAVLPSAGAPGPLIVPALIRDWTDTRLRRLVGLTVDLLGLLGVGPYEAAKELARADVRAALGDLEAQAWRAVFAVDRARLRLAASRERERLFGVFVAEARADRHRVERLVARGRLGPGQGGRAVAAVAQLEERHRLLVSARAARRRELVIASGLAPDSPRLDQGGEELLDLLGEAELEDHAPEALVLLERHPALRFRALTYALAEARLRRVVADQWPSLRAGPQLEFIPDEFFPGTTLSLGIPYPGSIEGFIAAAVEERRAARLAVEDLLLAHQAEIAARQVEVRQAAQVRQGEGPRRERGSARAWRAARASFSVNEVAIEMWFDALMLRSQSVLAELDAIERLATARLAFREVAALAPLSGGSS